MLICFKGPYSYKRYLAHEVEDKTEWVVGWQEGLVGGVTVATFILLSSVQLQLTGLL